MGNGIHRGDVLAVIPPTVLITSKTAVHYSNTASKLHKKWANMLSPDHIMLQRMLIAIFLLEQTAIGSRSPYFSYIKHLPSSVSHLPIFWSEEQMRMALQTSNIYKNNIHKDETNYKAILQCKNSDKYIIFTRPVTTWMFHFNVILFNFVPYQRFGNIHSKTIWVPHIFI